MTLYYSHGVPCMPPYSHSHTYSLCWWPCVSHVRYWLATRMLASQGWHQLCVVPLHVSSLAHVAWSCARGLEHININKLKWNKLILLWSKGKRIARSGWLGGNSRFLMVTTRNKLRHMRTSVFHALSTYTCTLHKLMPSKTQLHSLIVYTTDLSSPKNAIMRFVSVKQAQV